MGEIEVLDWLPSSTWQKFLTFDTDQPREENSSMLTVIYETILSASDNLRFPMTAKFKLACLPVRLNMDQDALEFFVNFFSPTSILTPTPSPTPTPTPTAPTPPPTAPTPPQEEIIFHTCEVKSLHVKIDYKPKRIDYSNLRSGNTLELLNLFPLEGAIINLEHVKLNHVHGWKGVAEGLGRAWLPSMKWSQLAGVVSGVQPIKPLINVGSSVANLVLLPIEYYKRDGRLLTGLQRGTTEFLKTMAVETLNVGSRFAAGTQVLLESADIFSAILEPNDSTTPTIPVTATDHESTQFGEDSPDSTALALPPPPPRRSKFADQPTNAKEGFLHAYGSLSRELKNAANTVICIPIEEYQRSGTTGFVRSVVRAVPVAILRPMIGITEGFTKTMIGMRNEMEPSIKQDMDNKYKSTVHPPSLLPE